MTASDSRRAFAVGFAAIAALATSFGRAHGPQAPVTAVVGLPRGHAASDRLGAARQGRSAVALPGKGARERWRRELPGGIELPPVVDGSGGVIAVLVTGDVARVTPDGKAGWRRRLPCSPGNNPPGLMSDGAIAVVCSDGALQRIAPNGKRLPEILLRSHNHRSECAPLGRDDNSLLVATDEELLHVDGDGVIRARTRFDALERPVGGLIELHHGVLLTLANGDVWQWQAPARARKLGSFGGTLERGAALLGPRAIAAVVGRDRLVAFDPVSRQTTVLADGAGLDIFEGPPSAGHPHPGAHAPSGELLIATSDGQLFGVDASATVMRRAALEPSTVLGDGGTTTSLFTGGFYTRPSPPLIVDPQGTIAFVRQSGRFGIVGRDDRVAVLDAAVCTRPVALLPAGPGRLGVACSTGTIVMWGDQ